MAYGITIVRKCWFLKMRDPEWQHNEEIRTNTLESTTKSVGKRVREGFQREFSRLVCLIALHFVAGVTSLRCRRRVQKGSCQKGCCCPLAEESRQNHDNWPAARVITGVRVPPPGTIKNSDKARHCAGFVVSAALLLLRRLKRDRCLFLAEPECVLPHTGKYLLLSSTAPSA
jgi:hypothetical protein